MANKVSSYYYFIRDKHGSENTKRKIISQTYIHVCSSQTELITNKVMELISTATTITSIYNDDILFLIMYKFIF